MDTWHIAAIINRDAIARSVMSARPDAPVVPERSQRPRRGPALARTRAVLASGLHRAGDAVAPRRCSPAA
jgi:hypothetical protein